MLTELMRPGQKFAALRGLCLVTSLLGDLRPKELVQLGCTGGWDLWELETAPDFLPGLVGHAPRA